MNYFKGTSIILLLYSSACYAKDVYVQFNTGLSVPAKMISTYSELSVVDKGKMRTSPAFSLTLGKKIMSNLSLELEGYYSGKKFDKRFKEKVSVFSSITDTIYNDHGTCHKEVSISSKAVFANFRYFFNPFVHNMIQPYLLAGFGASYNKSSRLKYNAYSYRGDNKSYALGKKKMNFSWQVGAGFTFLVNDFINLDLSARYRDLGRYNMDKNITVYEEESSMDFDLDRPVLKGKLSSYDLMTGLVFKF